MARHLHEITIKVALEGDDLAQLEQMTEHVIDLVFEQLGWARERVADGGVTGTWWVHEGKHKESGRVVAAATFTRPPGVPK